MGKVPIITAMASEKAPIIKRVEAILKDEDGPKVPALEAELDELVFALYKLTEAERRMVQEKTQSRPSGEMESDTEQQE